MRTILRDYIRTTKITTDMELESQLYQGPQKLTTAAKHILGHNAFEQTNQGAKKSRFAVQFGDSPLDRPLSEIEGHVIMIMGDTSTPPLYYLPLVRPLINLN